MRSMILYIYLLFTFNPKSEPTFVTVPCHKSFAVATVAAEDRLCNAVAQEHAYTVVTAS